jgi:ribosomal protein L32
MVVFAVPFSPRTRTPPTSGEMVVRIKASAMSSEPTTGRTKRPHTSHPSAGIHARGMSGLGGVRGMRRRPATAVVLTSRSFAD